MIIAHRDAEAQRKVKLAKQKEKQVEAQEKNSTQSRQGAKKRLTLKGDHANTSDEELNRAYRRSRPQ